MQLCHTHTFPLTLQVQTSHGACGRDQSTAGETVAGEALQQLPGGLSPRWGNPCGSHGLTVYPH